MFADARTTSYKLLTYEVLYCYVIRDIFQTYTSLLSIIQIAVQEGREGFQHQIFGRCKSSDLEQWIETNPAQWSAIMAITSELCRKGYTPTIRILRDENKSRIPPVGCFVVVSCMF